MHIKFEPENLKGRDCMGIVDVCGRIILKWMLRK
jgi:hypothetical protein